MTGTAAEWDVVFILPNLQQARAFPGQKPNPESPDLVEAGITLRSDSVAIVPSWDDRVLAAARKNKVVAQLISCFRNEYDRAIQPSVLIARRAAAIEPTLTAINTFRNIVAVSTVLPSRASWAASDTKRDPNWSDYFDFHPAQVGRHGIVTHSPALMSLHGDDSDYVAMPSPHCSDRIDILVADGFLYRALSSEWRRRFLGARRKSAYSRAVFRSLEFAYMALSAPTKQGGSQHEWGIQIAQWVSALEVLAWMDNEGANQRYVLNLLKDLPWLESRGLKARRYKIWLGKPVRVNAIQNIGSLLYMARHKFMHGDLLKPSLLQPWGKKGMSLPAIAPTVYRTALKSFLSRRYNPMKPWDDADWLTDYMDDSTYAQALRVAVGLTPQPNEEL